MVNLAKDIDSLTSFKQNSSKVIDQIKATGRPMVLTVNGKPELVIQDVHSYQASLEAIERLELFETLRSIQAGLDDVENGNVTEAEEVHRELRAKYGL